MTTNSKLFSYDQWFPQGQMQLPAGEIKQVAELTLAKSGEIVNHIQSCDEITYAVSGKATIYSGDSSFEMTAGQIHFIKKGQAHRIVADENQNFHFYCIGFVLDSDCPDIAQFTNAIKPFNSLLLKDEGQILSLFEHLLNEIYVSDSESKSMIYFYFCQILLLLFRAFKGHPIEKHKTISTSPSNYAVYHTLKHINREYIRITKVKQIAEELSYSEYYLSHVFKEKMGITIKDYLLQKKIITATALLKTSNMTISEIAEHLNFSSVHAFGKVFKRYMGMSASSYKQNSEVEIKTRS